VTDVPNQYYLQGGGISVAYSPEGWGPPRLDEGPLILTYQDAGRTQAFYSNRVQTTEVPALGTIVSVTLAGELLLGNTTFSLLIPTVVLPEGDNSVAITTDAITTFHRLFISVPQREVYTVTELTGTAVSGPLPL
jgi:hypothetical protein